ncbi:hypothetical protein EGR_10974 [Echinococcus granulosus]|uniref:Uncharacterized protein n=1 Tax=Echinococcus granulosus TaxID=6210 RepID=W6UKY9_ECHGR|nr:hypothetical protein EGR_10974 [Echinococcus granulosus]EUB54164.1 hypothetical protein EGR_10974 [Echinococcus granulosus]
MSSGKCAIAMMSMTLALTPQANRKEEYCPMPCSQ